MSEWLDDEGYPNDLALDAIKNWKWDATDKLFEFMRELWKWADDGYWSQEDDGEKLIYKISTGGWSGNESLIDALEQNLTVWSFTWVQSRRGGHYIFELPYKKHPLEVYL